MTTNGWIVLAAVGVLVAAPPAAADDGAEPLRDAGIRPVTPPRNLPPPAPPRADLPLRPDGVHERQLRWACTNLQNDRFDCGSCNNRCPANRDCVGGGCAPP